MILGAVLAGAFSLAFGPIADGDIYWHLAAGREMLQQQALLRTDPFTLSAAGRPWLDLHWLFQLGAIAVHRAAGFTGIAAVQAMLVAVGAGLATRTAERSGGPAAGSACALGLLGSLFLARHLLAPRPVIVTLVFLSFFLAVLEASRAAGRPLRSLLLLPLAQMVWTNCQGLSPLGPALVGAYLAAAWVAALRNRSRRDAAGVEGEPPAPERDPEAHDVASKLGLVALLCVLASFVTPYGLGAVALPWKLLARIVPAPGNLFSAGVAENVPPFVLERTAPEQAAHVKWFLAVLAAGFAVIRPRVHLAHVLILAGFVALALMAHRNVLLLYWVAVPLAAIELAPAAAWRLERARAWVSERRRRVGRSLADRSLAGRSLAGAAVTVGLAAELVLVAVARGREPAAGSPTPFHFPVQSARLLAARRAAGPVFTPDQHGGYLTFMLPAVHPYIDTRLVLHTADEYAAYLSLFADPARFEALDREHRFVAVVLTTAHPDQYLGLIRHLAGDPGFRLVFTDGYEVLFTHAGAGDTPLALGDAATVDEILGQLGARFGAWPDVHETARLHLARLLLALGHGARAEAVLDTLDSRAAAQLRGRAQFAAGRLAAAETLARILVHDDAGDVRGLTLLAEIATARGDAAGAEEWLRRALEVDPYDAEARDLLDRLGR